MKKVAETVRTEVSFSTLHNTLKSIGFSISKDTLIAYLGYAQEAYLLFNITNATAKFVEREGSPNTTFLTTGCSTCSSSTARQLSWKTKSPLPCTIASERIYAKSSKTGIDVDFYLPEAKLAIQVAYSIAGEAREREISNLIRLARADTAIKRLVIVTKEEEENIEQQGISIEVIPAWKFLLTFGNGESE